MKTSKSWVHLTARAYPYRLSVCDYDVAAWLWPRLRRRFPVVAATVFMPNHIHLTALCDDIEGARWGLANVLGALQRSDNPGAALRWQRVERPGVLEDGTKLSRVVRYDVLNPCRAGLATDPLSWPWSTHRDVLGAVRDPWVSSFELARSVGRRHDDFADWVHRYASSDPSVGHSGTPIPVPAPSTQFPSAPFTDLAAAAAAATRALPEHIRRRSATRTLFVHLARRAGWRARGLLASACGVAPQAISQILRTPPPAALLEAGALCLGDARLRVFDVSHIVPAVTFHGRARIMHGRGRTEATSPGYR